MSSPVRPAGLNQCCLDALLIQEQPGTEGEIFVCIECGDWTTFIDGAWGDPDARQGMEPDDFAS